MFYVFTNAERSKDFIHTSKLKHVWDNTVLVIYLLFVICYLLFGGLKVYVGTQKIYNM